MLDETMRLAITERLGEAPFARWMGIELGGLDDGEGVLKLSLQPHHLNPSGIVHGGIIASMVDAAIGLALRTKIGMEATHVTVQLNVTYIRAVRGGTLTAHGTCVHAGGRMGYGEATLTDADDRILARATATFMVVSGMDADV